MKQKNREALERAAGMLDALIHMVKGYGSSEAVEVAVTIIDAVLKDEEES